MIEIIEAADHKSLRLILTNVKKRENIWLKDSNN